MSRKVSWFPCTTNRAFNGPPNHGIKHKNIKEGGDTNLCASAQMDVAHQLCMLACWMLLAGFLTPNVIPTMEVTEELLSIAPTEVSLA